MDLEDYREDLINRIEAESIASLNSCEECLFDEVKDILIEDQGLVSELLPTYIDWTTSSNKFKNMHLDASYLESSTFSLTLLYSDYNSGPEVPINNEYVRNRVGLMEGFLDNVFRGFFKDTDESDPVTQLANEILAKQDDIDKLQLIIVSTNKYAERLNKTLSFPTFEAGNKSFKVDVMVLDIQGIYESIANGSTREKINIETKDFGLEKGIPCIKAEIESDDYESYLAVVPGQFLSDIYLEYNARLLENNVRSFLNTRGKINKGIQSTILGEKSKFFAYNNGIATTADNIKIVQREDGPYITEFDNLQIINGGQTTASLANASKKYNADLSGIFVQMKLSIITNKEKGGELVQSISKYANTQNKVTNADLRSNHDFYSRIESLSRSIKTPMSFNKTYQTFWYFERTRGQYEQERLRHDKGKDLNSFDMLNPKSQKFTKADLAKYLNSADMVPYSVSWGAEINLENFHKTMSEQWEKNDSVFNAQYYQDLIAKAIIFKAIDKIVAGADWYQENRAYKAQIVPYTFSKFVYEIGKHNDKIPDYQGIWNRQELIPEYVEDLKTISKLVHDVMFKEGGNIGEFAKKDTCWKAVQRAAYKLTDETLDHIVSKKDVEDANRAARKEQTFVSNVTSTIDIYKAGPNYWQAVIDLDKKIGVLTYTEAQLAQYALNYCLGRSYSMSDKQAKLLNGVITKMKDYDITPDMYVK